MAAAEAKLSFGEALDSVLNSLERKFTLKDEQRLALESIYTRHRAQGSMGSLWRVIDTRAVQSTATETTPPYEIMYSWSPDSITLVIEYGVCRQTNVALACN